MKQISLTNGKFAIVDDEDFNYLIRFNWISDNGHPARNVERKTILMADFVIRKPKGQWRYFFKNGNTFDLRKENIEIRTFSQVGISLPKMKRVCSSKFKGVCWNKRSKKWDVHIYAPSETKNDKRTRKHFYIGGFISENEAALAYNEKALELYGKFAYQNKI